MRFIPRPGLALAVLLALALSRALATAAEHAPAPAQIAQLNQLRPAAPPAAPPVVDGVPFLIQFGGTVRGLEPGAAVEISGIRIGAVRHVGLEFSPDRNGFVVPVEIELQPSLFPAAGPRPRTTEETYAAADALVRAGCARRCRRRSCWAARRS